MPWISMSLSLFIACQRGTVKGGTHDDALPLPDGSPPAIDAIHASDAGDAIDAGDVSDASDGSPLCVAGPSGPLSTGYPPRQTVPWMLIAATDGGIQGSDGGDAPDGGGAPGCVSSPVISPFSQLPQTEKNIACAGAVTARRAGTTFELSFADGSILRWQESGGGPAITAPALSDGQTAWVDYSRTVTIVCPVCGSFETTRLQIRAAATGPLIWIGRQGTQLRDVEPDLLQDLFGIGARVQGSCQEVFSAGCWNVTRQTFDHVLLTTPEQVIPMATLEHVTTPHGKFDVFWTYSTELAAYDRLCYDGPGLASDTGFAASRTAPP